MSDSRQGVPKDLGEAARGSGAAGQGNPVPRAISAASMQAATACPQDYVQAYLWASFAASRFPASAKEDRKQAAQNRKQVARLMTPEQIEKAEGLARAWTPAGPGPVTSEP